MKVLSLNLWFSDYLPKERTIIFKKLYFRKKARCYMYPRSYCS